MKTTNDRFREKSFHSSEDKNTPKEYINLSLKTNFADFSETFGMQGVRYMFLRNAHWMRRILWVLIVTTGFSYSVYIMAQNLKYYYTYPTTMQNTVKYNRTMKFPAVTICNLNMFQRSKLSRAELEILSHKYLNTMEIPEIEFMKSVQGPQNFSRFLWRMAYDYDENTISCVYKKRTCVRRMQFLSLSDAGVCITFDPSRHNNTQKHYQTSAGKNGGLNVVFYLDPRDNSPGPNAMYEGFNVFVHDRDEMAVSILDHGLVSVPRHANDYVIELTKTMLQKPPYGQCGERPLRYFDKYSQKACLMDCETSYVLNECGCKSFFMPGNDSASCSMDEWEVCYYYILEEAPFDPSKCDCPIECTHVEYRMKMSYIKMSKSQKISRLNHSDNIETDITDDATQIRIFFASFDYNLVEQKPVYNFEKLLSDVGGAAGLLLGCSLATFAELFDFVGVTVYMLFLKYGWRRKNQVQKINI